MVAEQTMQYLVSPFVSLTTPFSVGGPPKKVPLIYRRRLTKCGNFRFYYIKFDIKIIKITRKKIIICKNGKFFPDYCHIFYKLLKIFYTTLKNNLDFSYGRITRRSPPELSNYVTRSRDSTCQSKSFQGSRTDERKNKELLVIRTYS